MKRPVSVIVPVYNVEAYLAECLDSILAQTYDALEILCVNDGSTDGSAAILEEYAAKDERIRILTKTNGGLSDARNFGLDHSRGDYIACIDSDDAVTPDMIEKLVGRLEETSSGIAVCDMEYFYDDGRKSYSGGGDFLEASVREMPGLIAVNNSACNKLFKAELFNDVRFPVGKYYEDLAVIPILLYRAEKVCRVPEPLYRYRQRSGSIAHTASEKIFDIYDALDGVKSWVEENGGEEAVLKEIRRLYIVHGLDITTLRIRDFDDKAVRRRYLEENMRRLKHSYPGYRSDPAYRSAPFKKKLIWFLLSAGMYDIVLKLYDR